MPDGCCLERETLSSLEIVAGRGSWSPWRDMEVSSESYTGLISNLKRLGDTLPLTHATFGRPMLTVST